MECSGYVPSWPPKWVNLSDSDLARAMSAFVQRTRQGLSLSDISERTGIDRGTLSKLETGKVPNPTVGKLRALAGALNKRLSWSLADDPATVSH